jgi:hypothetical protein
MGINGNFRESLGKHIYYPQIIKVLTIFLFFIFVQTVFQVSDKEVVSSLYYEQSNSLAKGLCSGKPVTLLTSYQENTLPVLMLFMHSSCGT